MIVTRVCRQCGRDMAMEVRSETSHRRYCDDCRRKRAVQATLRSRKRVNDPNNCRVEVRTIRLYYSRTGALLRMEVVR